jgi:hypothetical protein
MAFIFALISAVYLIGDIVYYNTYSIARILNSPLDILGEIQQE